MNSSTDPAHLPASDVRVLVTGGSGYVGGHVVSRLLDEGHRVRGTVRSAAREQDLRALVTEVSGAAAPRLEVTVVDLSSDDGWEPRSVEATIVDTAQSLLDRGLVRRHHDE